jgi:hypothetical protein
MTPLLQSIRAFQKAGPKTSLLLRQSDLRVNSVLGKDPVFRVSERRGFGPASAIDSACFFGLLFATCKPVRVFWEGLAGFLPCPSFWFLNILFLERSNYDLPFKILEFMDIKSSYAYRYLSLPGGQFRVGTGHAKVACGCRC